MTDFFSEKTGVALRARRVTRIQRGMTLLEILIVIGLVTFLTVGVLSGTGVIGGARQRSAATLLMAAVRTGIMHANSTGMPARLVMDLDEDWIRLEETSGRMLRRLGEDGDSTAGAAPATEIEREIVEETQRILDGPREPPPTFVPIKSTSLELGEGGAGRPLGEGITFMSVQTEHDAEARIEGRAYLYFWPGGGTEKAIIRIRRQGQEEGVNVVVSALTGKAKLVRGEIEWDKPGDEVDFGEREEE